MADLKAPNSLTPQKYHMQKIRNCMSQFCGSSGKQSKVYSSQVNAQSRKSDLQNGGRVLWCSYSPDPIPSPGHKTIFNKY